MKNIEPPGKEHLASIIVNLQKGAYMIPDFQREFEWSPGDVNDLIRSIFEDYYVGTLLLWRATKENLKFLHCEPIYGHTGEQKAEHIVLDGQQRLSALFYALFAPSKNFPRRKLRYLFFVDLGKLLEEDYEEAFQYFYGKEALGILSDPEHQFERHLFPLKIFGDAAHLWLKWLQDYEAYWISKGNADIKENKRKIEELFSDLLNRYYICYIELDREILVDKVCDIFTRINNSGVDLDTFDLLNALLRPRNINLKQTWRDIRNEFDLPDPDKGKIIILQTMSLLKQDYCAAKFLYYLVPGVIKRVREKDGSFHATTLVNSVDEFKTLWKDAVDLNLSSLRVVSNQKDLGAIVPKFIPYPTLLPILAVLLNEKSGVLDQKGAEEKLRMWYWSSVFTQNYSSSVESQMAQDLREMRDWFANDAATPRVILELKNTIENINLLKIDSSGSAVYKGVFCLLARMGARDLSTWDLPEYSILDDHHIVPKSWGEKNAPDFANSIANRTPLSDDTNRRILRDRLPNIYILELIKKYGRQSVIELLSTHLISEKAMDVLLRSPFSSVDFEEFLLIRQSTIIDELKLRTKL